MHDVSERVNQLGGSISTAKLASSPYINRFLQPDSLIPNLYTPQSLNRFSYVRNNPIRFIDPTGHREESGYEGNQRPLDCKKYGQYCNVFGKSKSSDELAEMRKPKSTGSSNSDGHSCNGPNPSLVCLPPSTPQLDLSNLQFDPTFTLPTYGNGLIGPPELPLSPFDEFFQTLEFGSEAMDLVDLVEDGILVDCMISKST